MKNSVWALLISLILSFVFSCSEVTIDRGGEERSRIDSFRAIWNDYNKKGEFDLSVGATKGFFEKSLASKDTVSVLYSGISLASSYIMLEKLDSAKYCIDAVLSYGDKVLEPELGVALYNVLGTYTLKTELEYPKAIEYYLLAYKYATEIDDIDNKVVILTNIVNLFYVLSDKSGYDFALQAYNMSLERPVDSYAFAAALMSMAQMSFLLGEHDSSLEYLAKTDSVVHVAGLSTLLPYVDLMYADLYSWRGNESEAERRYLSAIEQRDVSEPLAVSIAFLKYGHFLETTGRYVDAIRYYHKCSDWLSLHSNAKFESEILKKFSVSYFKIGQEKTAFEYFRKYNVFIDSVSSDVNEKELNHFLLSYKDMIHQNEIQAKELYILKANRRLTVSLLVIVSITLLSVSLYMLYNRQRKLYSALVERHQNYLQRLDMEAQMDHDKSACDNSALELEKSLFSRLEEVMRQEKIYRSKDVSLESIARLLNSNRTYLSKAINRCAGMSFPNYVNMYRINEAAKIISDPSNTTPLKEIASNLGFVSVNAFYKSFQKETGCSAGRYRKEIMLKYSQKDADLSN